MTAGMIREDFLILFILYPLVWNTDLWRSQVQNLQRTASVRSFLGFDTFGINPSDFLFICCSAHQPAEAFLLNEHPVEVNIPPGTDVEGYAFLFEKILHQVGFDDIREDENVLKFFIVCFL